MSGWAAAAQAGSDMISAGMSSRASRKASEQQSRAAAAALQEQRRQYDLAREDQMPWMQTGEAGLMRLRDMLGLTTPEQSRESAAAAAGIKKPTMEDASAQHLKSHIAQFGGGYHPRYSPRDVIESQTKDIYNRMLQEYEGKVAQLPDAVTNARAPDSGSLLRDFTNADFVKDPGYDFRLSEGNKAVENAARARGTYMSPMTVKELLRYGQDYASNEFGNAYNRDMSNKTTKFNMLSGISGTGQTAANTVGNAGANMVNNVGQLMTGAANARGAAGIAGTNAWGNAMGNINSRYQQQSFLDRVFPRNNVNYNGQSLQQDNYSAGYY